MSGAAGKRHQSGRTTARQSLMTSLLDAMNKEEMLNTDEYTSADMDGKFSILSNAITEINGRFAIIHEIINNATDGIDPRTMDCEERVVALVDENKNLRFELDVLKGLFARSEAENTALKNKVTALSAKDMKDNIIIAGLCADESQENPKITVQEFLSDKMDLEFPSVQITAAKHIGAHATSPTIPRLMVVTLHSDLKSLVLSNLKNLKGKKNQNDKAYRVSKQLPDQWVEENRKLREEVQKARKTNDSKDEMQQKDDIQVKYRTLYINKKPQKKIFLPAPSALDVFPDRNEQEKLDKIKFAASTSVEENQSEFTAYALKLQSITEVRRAYVRIRQLHPSAAHIVASYVVKNGVGFQDDREYGAGHRVLNIIETNNYMNIAAFVVRYHGGRNLGPKRHVIMEQVVIDALARTKTKQTTGVTAPPQ